MKKILLVACASYLFLSEGLPASAANTAVFSNLNAATTLTDTGLATAGVNCTQVGSTGQFQLPGGTNIGGCPVNATNATFVIPAVGGSVAVHTLNFSAFPKNGLPFTVDDGTNAMYGLITANANTSIWTVTNLGLSMGSVGNTMATAALIYPGAALVAPAKLPTLQTFTSGTGTYTTPAGVLWIKVTAVGGGGGGGGSDGTSGMTAGTGGPGGSTTFGSSLIAATGGSGGTANASAGFSNGGVASCGSGPLCIAAVNGGGGSAPSAIVGIAGTYFTGGAGGSTALGGAGGAAINQAGQAGTPNSGGGGSGAASSNAASTDAGGGGAAGAYVQAIIETPSATYSYTVGGSGTAGTAGTSGAIGGAGGSGLVSVEEYYSY